MKKQIAFFDFDGTLADTAAVIRRTINDTLARLNREPAREDEFKNYIGLPLARIFELLLPDADKATIDFAVRFYREKFPGNCAAGVKLYPGVRQTLKTLRDRDFCLAVASSREKASLLSLVNRLNIAPDFALIAGEQDVAKHKPEPDIAEHVLRKTGIPASDAMFVGDTVFDIKCGEAAGMKTCGVSYGFQPGEKLRLAGADYVIDAFPDILGVLEKTWPRPSPR